MFIDSNFMHPRGSNATPRIIPEYIEEFFLEHLIESVFTAGDVFGCVGGEEAAVEEPDVHG